VASSKGDRSYGQPRVREFLSLDRHEQRKLRFYYGDTVLREAGVAIGESRTIQSRDKQWTFIALKGAFLSKRSSSDTPGVSEWLYAANDEPVPAQRPVIENGLGRYVIFLPNGYAIHSPPSADSPLQGPKPGSYMVSEDVLRAIWPRIHKGTQVFIF
jgi:hypothetical protein